MAVTWTSGYNVDEAYPFVEWTMNGKENARARRSPADTLTFTRNHLCGKVQSNLLKKHPNHVKKNFYI